MGIVDKMGNAANIAKWKADQQVRILKKQGEIRDIEAKVYTQKAAISELVLFLFSKNQIENEDLKTLCNAVTQLQKQIQAARQEIEFMKQEQPPVQIQTPLSQVGAPATSGLVCPVCGMALVGKFCPVHGVEGVPAANSSGLVCPVCGQTLVGKYCPKDGVEGVPASPQFK